MTTATAPLPDLIEEAQTTEEAFLRQISCAIRCRSLPSSPLVMAAPMASIIGTCTVREYLDANLSIYVVSVGHNNRRVIEAIKTSSTS